ncbi:MAG: hypothetical protein ABFD12_14370 [Syntrophorhabdus sp.]
MDETFDISLLRNVQPTDRKMSVSKEFVGPRKREERKQRNSSRNGSTEPEKPARLYTKDKSRDITDDEEHGLIDITI